MRFFNYHMVRVLSTMILLTGSWVLKAQNPNGNYNPYVNGGIISPAPLWPLELNGKGMVSFNFGNTGSDPLEVYSDQYITLTIVLSHGEPDHANPLLAVGGTSAGLFSWTFNSGRYTGTQIAVIPANSSGTITIAYKVSENSSLPGSNGFDVQISPAPYQTTSNTINDDAVSSYTFTEVRDFGDAPVSYGSASHILDFTNYLGSSWDGEMANQPSATANADDSNGLDDEDGVTFPAEIRQAENLNISVTVVGMGRLNAWIDWNGDGDFADTGEQIADNLVRLEGTADLAVAVPSGAITSVPTFSRFRFSPGTLTSSSGSASGGEVEDYMITILPDIRIPTVPTGLRIISSSMSAVNLAWNASTDNVGVTGYRIYRGDSLIGTSTSLAYNDNTVNAGNVYTYTVSAIDADGNESGQSAGVSINIVDIEAPAVPANVRLTSASDSTVSITWNASTDNVGVTGYRLYRGGVLIGTTADLVYTDSSVKIDNTYTYTVTALDAAGNESAVSSRLIVSINDTESPTVPSGLQVVSVSVSGLHLSWEASTDNVEVTGYNIYREGILIATVNDLSWTDKAIIAGNTYSYSVSAMDDNGNVSEICNPVTISISVTEFLIISQLDIYPNPSDGNFTLEINEKSGKFTLEIMSASGTIHIQTTIYVEDSSIPLTCNNLGTGFYFVRLYNDERIYYGKLEIQE